MAGARKSGPKKSRPAKSAGNKPLGIRAPAQDRVNRDRATYGVHTTHRDKDDKPASNRKAATKSNAQTRSPREDAATRVKRDKATKTRVRKRFEKIQDRKSRNSEEV